MPGPRRIPIARPPAAACGCWCPCNRELAYGWAIVRAQTEMREPRTVCTLCAEEIAAGLPLIKEATC